MKNLIKNIMLENQFIKLINYIGIIYNYYYYT